MGGQDSKPLEQDYFLLQAISKMALSNQKIVSYYFIHPQKDQAIECLLKNLRNYFKIDHFLQIKTLKQEMNFVNRSQLVKIILSSEFAIQDMDYLLQEKKVYQIIIFGDNSSVHATNQKIVRIVKDIGDLTQTLNELQGKDSLKIPSSNILLVDQDTKLLNKYRLNYHCNTKYNGRRKAKEDFAELAKYLFPNRLEQIKQFTKQYNLELEKEQKYKMILQWAFKDSFYWQLVSEITRNTTDPKKLAYIRLALKDLFECIQHRSKSQKNYDFIYIVIDITQDQLAKLDKAKGRYLLFTSFIKGYTNEQQANAQLKQRPHSFKFTIAPNRGKLEPSLDFGYVVRKGVQPNVILNIYNVFQIIQVTVKIQRGQILYGALPWSYVRRQDQNRPKMTNKQLDLMRNYDYLEDMMTKIDSQATLLQLSGYYKQSLQVYDKKTQSLRKTNFSQQSMNRCMIYKADALRISGQFQNAQNQYLSVQSTSEKMKLISLIHLAELYMHRGKQQKFDKVIDEISPKIQCLKQDQKEEYYKARNFVVIRAIKKGNYIKAEQMLTQLQIEVTSSYPYNLEGKPVIHDIYRCIATCKSKLGKHSEALDLLKNTLSWQLVCEGKTANVALTETLIQSVSRSSGNNEELEQSLARLSAMSEEVQSSQSRFESTVGTDLNKSLESIKFS